MKELSMHYSFRNTLCGLAVLIAAGMLSEQAFAQGTVTLLADDEDEVSLAPDTGTSVSEDISLMDQNMNVDVSLPGSGGLISPSGSVAQSTPSDEIPMEINTGNPSQVSVNFDDSDADIDMQIEAEPRPVAAQSQPMTAPAAANGGLLGAPAQAPAADIVLTDTVNNELFSRMSDLEKQTTLLNLELKKERIANEVAAVKAQRLKAQQEEEARKQEEERKRIEWQNEQDRLMVEEQRKLKEVEMAMEKLRQEKIVKAYKETMLASTQKWIKKNAEVYAEMAKKDEQIKELLNDYKNKLGIIQQKAEEAKSKAEAARINHDKKVANLESQISILKTRLEAEIEKAKQAVLASKTSKKNPFAGATSEAVAPEKVKLSKEYAIMEITGQGDELAAKLINEDGDVFMAKVGTTLRNGYTIDEITQTFLSGVKDNEKDYLYFSAGGILDREPVKSDITLKDTGSDTANGGNDNSGRSSRRRGSIATTSGIPSLGRGMIIK